jgi:bifunctional DNA-binding transcriptional regulator/antitoxin component of YhaV-PrlF toxin-antitoxin module
MIATEAVMVKRRAEKRAESGRTKRAARAVRDARPAYRTGQTEESGWIPLMDSRLSSKNQITIPVRMTRALDWRPGDEINLMVHGDLIILSRLPRTLDEWGDHLRGSVDVPEWNSKEAIDAWVRNERNSWDREWDRE